MNWGLFLALAGFLLPLSLALRVLAMLVLSGAPLGHPSQATRIVQLLLLAVPITGKTPAMIYALTGKSADLGRLTESWMVTPWGFAQTAVMFAAVIAADVYAPRIVAQLERGDARPPKTNWTYLRRDATLATVLIALAWIAAR